MIGQTLGHYKVEQKLGADGWESTAPPIQSWGGRWPSKVLPEHFAKDPEEPDWSALPDATPAHVQTFLRRCLQRIPQKRLRDIADARMELEAPAGSCAGPGLSGRRLAL